MVDFMRIFYWWTTLDIGKSNTADSENVKFELIEKYEKYGKFIRILGKRQKSNGGHTPPGTFEIP